MNQPETSLLNAFDDAREAILAVAEIMGGEYDTTDIQQCLDSLYEAKTHLRSVAGQKRAITVECKPPSEWREHYR